MQLISSLLMLGAAGVLCEAIATRREAARFPAPGQRVDIGGRRLHAQVLGTGEPTVVLEAGAGEWSTHWGSLPARLAPSARIVAYDRGGLGWSDMGPNSH
jgi:pimeloyl-ACP methyl ester carboxylesterase